jgi:simple sugar transport system permease protein
VIASYLSGNPWIGVLGGILCGALLGAIHAYASVNLRIDQVVLGIAINIFALGTTTTLARLIFREERVQVAAFEELALPVCSDIPVIGPIFCQHAALVYIVILIVIIAQLVLFRTTIGMSIRSVGENPKAAESAGINVSLIKYACTIYGGMMAGLGGSFLSLVQLNLFVDNMTAGKGWIALAAVVFGRWSPLGSALGSLLFGFLEAVGLRVQALALPIPHELLLMLPYLTTFLVFAGVVGRSRAPASLAKPYTRESL